MTFVYEGISTGSFSLKCVTKLCANILRRRLSLTRYKHRLTVLPVGVDLIYVCAELYILCMSSLIVVWLWSIRENLDSLLVDCCFDAGFICTTCECK